MLPEIHTDTHYHQAMAVIEIYLAKGVNQFTEVDMAELQRLSVLFETYEDTHYPMPLALS